MIGCKPRLSWPTTKRCVGFAWLLVWTALGCSGSVPGSQLDATGKAGEAVQTFWLSTRTLKAEGMELRGHRQGVWRFYAPDQSLRIEANYRNGLLEGPLEAWSARGLAQRTGTYLKGKRHGDFVWNDDEGQRYLEGHFANDERSGRWRAFSGGDTLRWEGHFEADVKSADWSVWQDGALLERRRFVAGLAEGPAELYHASGEVQWRGRYHRGQRVGVWQQLDTLGGVITERQYPARKDLAGPATPRRVADALRDPLRATRTRLEPEFEVEVFGRFMVASELSRPHTEQAGAVTLKQIENQMLTRFTEAAPPPGTVTVYLFQGRDSYAHYAQAWHGRAPESAAGYATGSAIMVDASTGTGTLTHELVHVYIHADFPNVPIWFDEGFASLFEESMMAGDELIGLVNWRLELLLDALRAGRSIGLLRLLSMSRQEFRSSEQALNYASARYLCLFLQHLGLLERYYRAFRHGHQRDSSGALTLLEVTGAGSIADLEARWRSYVVGLEPRARAPAERASQ